VITLTNQTDGLYFYSELINGSFVEGSPYLFTFTGQYDNDKVYNIPLNCTLTDGYITVFTGDLTPIDAGINFSIAIEEDETLEMLRAEWNA
jgi:hypothetical protein